MNSSWNPAELEPVARDDQLTLDPDPRRGRRRTESSVSDAMSRSSRSMAALV